MSPRQRQGSPHGHEDAQGQRCGEAVLRAAERKAEALKAAARSRHADALARADKGLRQLLKSGAEVNFRAVARAGSVSLNFLYEEPELRKRIERLRSQQQAGVPARRSPRVESEPSSSSNMVGVLAAQMKAERARHLEQARELEEKLAAAHAEILRLTRALAADQGTAGR